MKVGECNKAHEETKRLLPGLIAARHCQPAGNPGPLCRALPV
jgi:hypothetical protein